jgi:pimeloyl-ACP methyl ester carboxylesterase
MGSLLLTVSRRTAARLVCLLLCAVLGCTPAHVEGPAYRSDDAREQRWADEIVPALVVGAAIWIQPPGPEKKFLAILTEPKPDPKSAHGAIVLVHGMGANPDYGVIGSLRTQLADAGYTTLSIQMPVLAADAPADRYPALFPEGADRIAAAVAWLQARKYRRIVLVSHSMGARMANHYLGRYPDAPIAAWVALGISSGEFEPGTAGRVRIFDIYAENDFPAVTDGAADRAKVLARVHGSRQAMVYGTDHYFTRKEKELSTLIQLLLESPRS